MLVVDRPDWFKLVFSVRGHVLPAIRGRVIVITLFALLVTVIGRLGWMVVDLTTAPFVIMGLPLGIFLGFRNSASYDRFWEGRRLWGQLVNTSRTFARQILTLIRDPADGTEARALRERMVRRNIAFAHALRAHLRGEKLDDALPHLADDTERAHVSSAVHGPNTILLLQGQDLSLALSRGWLESPVAAALEASLVSLTDVLGACERIRNTPVPFSYVVLLHRLVAGYCFLLPFGLVHTLRLATPVVAWFASYALFGLDAIGDEIENPFGTDTNDLPLSALSRAIEIHLREMLGERDLPAPLQPVGHVLS